MRPLHLLILLVLTTSAVAADPAILARHDIVDVRAGREPTRVHLLGWADDGSVYVRTALCETGSGSGLMHCRVTVDRIRVDGSHETTVLFDHQADEYCDGDGGTSCRDKVIPTAAASKFIAAEAAFMAKLPPLTRTTELADGTHALGSDVTLEMPWRSLLNDEAIEAMEVSLVATHGQRRTTLVTQRRGDSRIEVGPTFRAWISPDHTTALVAVRYGTGVMCWGPHTNIDLHRIDITEARAKI